MKNDFSLTAARLLKMVKQSRARSRGPLLDRATAVLGCATAVLGRARARHNQMLALEASPGMATLLLTVEACYPSDQGLVVLPCLPLKALASRPEFRRLQQGSRIEVRRPDGTRLESRIATYGAPVEKGADGSFYIRGGPDGPEFEIRFTLAPELSPEEVPIGTEVWYLDEGEG